MIRPLDVIHPAICWLFVDCMIYPKNVESLNLISLEGKMINKSDLETTHEDLLHLIVESARVHPPIPLSFAEILGSVVSNYFKLMMLIDGGGRWTPSKRG